MSLSWHDLPPAQRDAFAEVLDAHLLRSEITAAQAPAGRRVGFADLYAAATDPDAAFDGGLRRALDAEPRLRRDLARILRRTARWHGPRLAAASGGGVEIRHGDGFVLRLKPSSSTPGETYVLIELTEPGAQPPALIIVQDTAGGLVKQALPPGRQGRIQILAAEDSDLVRALRAPDSEVFLR